MSCPVPAEKLDLYRSHLLKWNRRVPLVSRRATAGEIETDLFEPLLSAVAAIGRIEGQLMDIGAGSGMGGLLFALANPGLRVTLVDRNGKKVSFMKDAIRILGLADRVTALKADAGDLDWEQNRPDWVFMRAVGEKGQILEVVGSELPERCRLLLVEAHTEPQPAGWSIERDVEVGARLRLRVLRRDPR